MAAAQMFLEKDICGGGSLAAAAAAAGSSSSLDPLVMMEDDPSCYRKDMWGYSVHTQSDDCISFINRFYRQV
jgi:hypothetical protein